MKNPKDLEKLESKHKEKIKSYTVKVTSYISGNAKNRFLNDCIVRGVTESDLTKEIIKLHYALIDSHNIVEAKEFCELLKIIGK